MQPSRGDFSFLFMPKLKKTLQILHLLRSVAFLGLFFFLLGEAENASLFAAVELIGPDDVVLLDDVDFCGPIFPAISVLVA